MPDSLLPHAKRMRHEPTEAEACLWRRLRAGRLRQYKFKRQQPMASYIVDFVCFEQKLVIEADGSQHLENSIYDEARNQWLQSQGFTVLRFWNDDILRDTDVVLDTILRALESKSRPLSRRSAPPSPTRGEG